MELVCRLGSSARRCAPPRRWRTPGGPERGRVHRDRDAVAQPGFSRQTSPGNYPGSCSLASLLGAKRVECAHEPSYELEPLSGATYDEVCQTRE